MMIQGHPVIIKEAKLTTDMHVRWHILRPYTMNLFEVF